MARKKEYDEGEDSDLIDEDEEEFFENRNYYNGEKTSKMEEYERQTGKYSIWRGVVTEGFKKWLKGERVYNRDKERISLYVSDDTKKRWQDFIEESSFTTISKLIRESVRYFIKQKANNSDTELSNLNPVTISNISHALKEPLTSIKGYSQLLLENYQNQLSEHIANTVRNIFDQSILLENKIINFLDNIQVQQKSFDVLLIEDDISTIRLITSYFESKGYSCKGVVSGSKGIEELKNNIPKIVLLDIILPDINGFHICKTIKSDLEYKKIPVYFLTAIAGSEVEKNLNDTGADGYILKPFNFSDFEIIFEILENNGNANQTET